MTKESFLLDGKTQSAVILKLIVIGEEARKLPDEIKNKIKLLNHAATTSARPMPYECVFDTGFFAIHAANAEILNASASDTMCPASPNNASECARHPEMASTPA